MFMFNVSYIYIKCLNSIENLYKTVQILSFRSRSVGRASLVYCISMKDFSGKHYAKI